MQDEAPRSWRTHPLARRLPVLLLAVGLWWWKGTRVPERELRWRLEGPGWSDVRALDFQVMGADGELVKRETFAFAQGPPDALSLHVALPPGVHEVRIFARDASEALHAPRIERLDLGDEEVLVERPLRVPGSR